MPTLTRIDYKLSKFCSSIQLEKITYNVQIVIIITYRDMFGIVNMNMFRCSTNSTLAAFFQFDELKVTILVFDIKIVRVYLEFRIK